MIMDEPYLACLSHTCIETKERDSRRAIDHQLEIMDFYVGLQGVARKRTDVQLIYPEDLVAAFPDRSFATRNPFALKVKVSHQGTVHEIGLVPDLVFGLKFPDGSGRCFMVEVDRGTIPVVRSDIRQTSFERKMRAYLTAHAEKQHVQRFGWRTLRVLTATTDDDRKRSMMEALRQLRIPNSSGASLFFSLPETTYERAIRLSTSGRTESVPGSN
jgi:hypothetical protein